MRPDSRNNHIETENRDCIVPDVITAFLFTRTTSQSPRLRETLATVAITRGNSRSVFSLVRLLWNMTIHALTELQRIFPLSYCNSGVIPLKYAYLPFSSILGILIVRSFPAAVISSKSNVTIQYLHSYVQKSIPDQLRWWDFCLPAYVFLRSAQQVRRPTEQLQKMLLFMGRNFLNWKFRYSARAWSARVL